jgi:hypothetical protein
MMLIHLVEDVIEAGATVAFGASPGRALFVSAGSISWNGRSWETDDGFAAAAPDEVTAGPAGACLWRWELSDPRAAGARHRMTPRLSAAVPAELANGSAFIRLDSVSFPPGGTALLHTHRGPGIRCMREGSIRIDTLGHSTSYGPGSPWFEAGPDPVFAQADMAVASRFIRAMVLPAELWGKPSIRYVNAEDQDKPKSQSYRQFGEALLSGGGT